MGARRKKKRTHVSIQEASNTPKSFVIKSGEVGRSLGLLVRDIRRTMEPNTATKLKERRGNKIKDFVHVASQLSVTHALIFSRNKTGVPNMRVGRIPRGPTLSFHITSFSLAKDILALQASPKSPSIEFLKSPLVVLNNFAGDAKHIKLIATMFQNLFPPIRVQQMKLTDARRVVIFNLNADTGRVEFRHYRINIKAIGLSKSVKSLIRTNIPDLKGFKDISDYVMREAFASESDVEDATESTVTLPDGYQLKDNPKSGQRAIKLVELGPRMELELVKIQGGLCAGEVIHHAFVKKTSAEIQATESRINMQRKEKDQRRAQQEKNVQAKADAKKKRGDKGTEGKDDAGDADGEDDEENDDDLEDLDDDEEADDDLEDLDDMEMEDAQSEDDQDEAEFDREMDDDESEQDEDDE
ncbi:hypothetical protein BASA61_009957 [Batrachochytrium salamandrivorans]|nr:hypothetical protein BASA62_009645 [Batrachochytrium salamandrivorans]KAH6579969.1 hypothetical protein BASA61_009957 [Batrachochytrium salamandrivorans]KAH9246722.1 hypothetical protein BASA81_015726 [Batrachochytrium salamandrivorans]KAH9267856.1 hypothetical protein BASA83_009680 [Batrachochytrium salamandrivorans]KAJ1334625.1 hypothetical protein BSLG_007780 [Batrachochytrium salamandrivorans]